MATHHRVTIGELDQCITSIHEEYAPDDQDNPFMWKRIVDICTEWGWGYGEYERSMREVNDVPFQPKRPNTCGIRFSRHVVDHVHDVYIAVRSNEELWSKVVYISGFYSVDIRSLFIEHYSEGHSLQRIKPLMDELAPLVRGDHVQMAKACGYNPNVDTLRWEFMQCESGEWRYCIQKVEDEEHGTPTEV